MARHMRRQHNTVANFEDSSDEHIVNMPTGANQKAFSTFVCDIRTTTLCMIRRTDGCNLPQMASYLATHFPQILSDWRLPIIVATFTDTSVTFQSGNDEEDNNTDKVVIEKASFDVDTLLESNVVRSSVLTLSLIHI